MTRDEFSKTIEAISAKSRILQSLSLDPEKDAVYNDVKNSVVETSDKAIAEFDRLTARVAELEQPRRMIKGGQGSHWEGCEETHWDCKIAKLEEEIERLKKKLEGVK